MAQRALWAQAPGCVITGLVRIRAGCVNCRRICSRRIDRGENRVTATLLAVLERLSLPHIDRILGSLLEDTAFSLLTFENQPKREHGITDARIGTGNAIVIETKTATESLRMCQIKNHLTDLRENERLLLITPDEDEPVLGPDKVKPSALDDRLTWSNFTRLASVVGDILGDDDDPPSENEGFLLRELMSMLRDEGLVGVSAESRVLVVPARFAWPTYQAYGAYVCQPHRSFRSTYRLAFYANGAVQPLVPEIKGIVESMELTPEGLATLDGDVEKELAAGLLAKIETLGSRWGKSPHKVMFLSGPSDDATMRLERQINNDTLDKNGNNVAYVFGQRYVTLESLRQARLTRELVSAD